MRFTKAFLAIFILLVGCNNGEGIKTQMIDENEKIQQHLAMQAKEALSTKQEILNVYSVNDGRDIYVVIRVKQFSRFRLKSIKEESEKLIKKQIPQVEVFISTDRKVYSVVANLEKMIANDQMNKKQLQEEVKKIKKMMEAS